MTTKPERSRSIAIFASSHLPHHSQMSLIWLLESLTP